MEKTARLHLTAILSSTNEPVTFRDIREQLQELGFVEEQISEAILDVGSWENVATWIDDEVRAGLLWMHPASDDEIEIDIDDDYNQAGGEETVTIPSGRLNRLLEESLEAK